MAAYPSAVATFTGFTSSHTLAADSHAAQHNLEQAEIVATQTKIGIGSSTPTSSVVLRGTGPGTSAWGQVQLTTDITGILPQANGGTGTTSATGTGAAVYQVSPTLTTPVIGSFINAVHNHTNPAGGGVLSLVNSIAPQVFTSNNTYTPNGKMLFCIIEVVGGGGGGGGCTSAPGAANAGAGGGAGGYSRSVKTAAAVGASQTVTIGAGGAGSAGAAGGAGGDTSVGALVIGKGGTGGNFGSAAALIPAGGAGGVAGTGDVTIVGNQGDTPPFQGASLTFAIRGGAGGIGTFGGGVTTIPTITLQTGASGSSGSGGSGGAGYNSATPVAGGSGGNGLVIITEFLSL